MNIATDFHSGLKDVSLARKNKEHLHLTICNKLAEHRKSKIPLHKLETAVLSHFFRKSEVYNPSTSMIKLKCKMQSLPYNLRVNFNTSRNACPQESMTTMRICKKIQ
jgi:hypothetical protein